MIVELNKLKQTGNYDEYVEKFEELQTYMVLNDSNKYSEDYFVASFLSGLSEELRAFINMFQPETLRQAIELGKKQLITLDAISKMLQSADEEEEILEAPKAIEINMVQPVEEITDLDEIVDLANDAAHVKPTLIFTPFLEEHSGMSNAVLLQNRSPIVYLSKTLSVRNPDFYLYGNAERQFKKGIGTTTAPVVKLSETDLTRTYKIFVLATLGDLNLISRKFSTLDPCGQGSAAEGGMVIAYVKKKGKVIEAGGGEKKELGPMESFEDARVQFQVITNEVDCNLISVPVLYSLIHEEIKNTEDIFVLQPDDNNGRLTSNLEPKADVIDLMIERQNFMQALWGNLLQARHHLNYFTHKKREKNELLCILNTHLVNREMQEISQILVQRLKARSQLATWEELQYIFCKFHHIKSSVLYNSEHQQFHEIKDELPEIESVRNFKIEPLLVLSIRNLMRKGEKAAKIFLQGLKTMPEFVIWEIEKFLRRKFLCFDPCGQGSSEAGGIVMAQVGMNCGGDGVKKKGWAPE